LKEGLIVKSLKGHDTGRVYLVIARLDENFVLLCDGKYRKLDNPKQKRIKHLEIIGEVTFDEKLTDSSIRKTCKL
jgi:ribosomal protein L14E/L6E/L27E